MKQLDQVHAILHAWRPEDEVRELAPLTPDASMRRYFRAKFVSGTPASVVVMVYQSVHSPEYEGATSVPADQAYVELSTFLKQHSVAVPELYLDRREQGVLVLEDLGDRLLADIAHSATADRRRRLFEAAIEQLRCLQAIPRQDDFFAFNRSFASTAYYNEMCEFRDYLMRKQSFPETAYEIVDRVMKLLAETLTALPRVLAHRDFHAWNLLIDQKGAIRVIDFQDALLAPAAYDIVALLNDRDMDSTLGQKAYCDLLKHFCQVTGQNPDFLASYDLVLLQRDLKVAGRFAKLSSEKGLKQYRRWIPGTLCRIGRTLARIDRNDALGEGVRELETVLAAQFDDIAEGTKEKRWY